MKKIILFILLETLTFFTFSQEVTVYVGGGLAGQQHSSKEVTSQIKPGGHLGISYTHFFTGSLGIASGLEFGLSGNKISLNNNYNYDKNIVDDEGEAFQYRINTEGYKENSSFTALAIPLMLQYRIGAPYRFYINGGAKFIIPQNTKISSTADKVNLSAYYSDKNLQIDNLPQHGFGTITNWSTESNFEQKITVALSLETGLYFNIKENSKLYAGFYVDYGLTDMRKDISTEQDKPFIEYSPSGIENAKSNGIINVNSDKLNLLAFGIQLKYAFNFKKKEEPKEEPAALEQKPIEKEETKKIEEKPVEKPVEKVEVIKTIYVKEEKVEDRNDSTQIKEEEIKQIEQTIIKFPGGLGSTKLSEQSCKELDKLAGIMGKNKNSKFVIIGHTCDISNKEVNYRIGMERANAVADYLVKKGISRERLKTVSKGKDAPLMSSKEQRSNNRRVEFKIIR